MKDYNVIIDGKKLFLINRQKIIKVTYENIRSIATGQGDNCTTGCLLDYIYFENYCKMIAVDLSKHFALGADPKQFNKLILPQT